MSARHVLTARHNTDFSTQRRIPEIPEASEISVIACSGYISFLGVMFLGVTKIDSYLSLLEISLS